MRYSFTSSEAILMANGRAGDVLRPWTIIIDTDDQTITIRKRNSYFIGTDEDMLAFRYIRRVTIDEHLFGADITISAVGGKVTACGLEKSACKRIKQILVDYNKTRKSSIVFS